MSDNDNSVRRVGRQDRKEQLDPVSPVFPTEDISSSEPSMPDEEAPDFLALLPDEHPDEGLDVLASLPPRVLRPNAITPAEERFPPTAPPLPAPRRPSKAPAARPVAKAKPRNSRLYNVITFIAFLGTLAALAVFGIVWTQPQSRLNPFPPPVEFVYVTATPGTAPEPTLVATLPPAPLVIDAGAYPFVMADTLLYAPNGNGLGCAWGSIAGSVTARDGSPLDGYRVHITGGGLDEVAYSGAALTFGPGGYEMPLGSVPQTQDYTVQLFSPQDAPLSPAYPITTQAACEQNVAVVNFREAS